MQKKMARDALDIYKKFLIRMDRVADFLKVAEVQFSQKFFQGYILCKTLGLGGGEEIASWRKKMKIRSRGKKTKKGKDKMRKIILKQWKKP